VHAFASRTLDEVLGEQRAGLAEQIGQAVQADLDRLGSGVEVLGAAVEAIRLETPEDKQWREGKLPEALRKARAHPEWSSLNGRRVGG
ncbi:SPFH domain-containing protein, partial [Morganella morganii]